MSIPTPAPRYRPVDRHRISTATLDEQLPADHLARTLWDFVGQLDLTYFHRRVRAVVGHPGAPPFRPEVLFALWLLATCEGIASAHELAQRCGRDLPYQWLCGGRPINYHTLADFYGDHHDELHRLFVAHIAALLQHGLATLQRVAVDGTKMPAAAQTAGLHREPTLQRHLQEAEAQVGALEQQRAQAAAAGARREAARRRAARERVQRLRAAVAQVRQIQEQRRRGKDGADPAEARASETDPEARRLKQPDGGYRLGYNVQAVTDVGSGLVVAVDVTAQGSDTGRLLPLVRQLQAEQGVRPREVLADSGFVALEDIQQLEQEGVAVWMPPPRERQEQAQGRDPYQPKRGDSVEVARWRARLGTPPGRAIYQQRCGVAEWLFAQWANRGWQKIRLRGRVKAGLEALWQGFAHNLLRLRALAVRAAAA
jgi:transposase